MADMAGLPQINLMLPCARPRNGQVWGDYYFGQSLADAMRRRGARVHVHCRNEPIAWPYLGGGVDLVIRGKRGHPRLWRDQYLWVMSREDTVSERVMRRARHVFCASLRLTRAMVARGISASFMPQCTDAAVFSPDKARADLAQPALFVGNRRPHFPRAAAKAAIDAGVPIKVFGNGWEDAAPPEAYGGRHIPNGELGAYYASAGAVLNDHAPALVKGGFVSNRAFDVLASGARLVSDLVEDMPEDLRPFTKGYRTPDEAPAALRAALAEGPLENAAEVAEYVRQNHSFDARAARILDVIGGASR